ncbi:MAG TPA: hypothetical protein VGO47_01325 [Chlamydiales bacterium]|nr:hypothetical protein [Chlamydiales bacterium]
MQLFDYTVAESQPQWSAASNSTIESRQALGGGSTAMPPRSKRARSVLGESESRGEQGRYEKNPQASVERAESGEQSRHEESLQTSQRRRRKTSQRSAPKTQRSARKQQKFDSLPALETPGIPWLMIPNKLSQIPEYTYFDPRISQPPIPYGSRLSLYSQNPDPSTRIHQPFRCRYIDPWAHNLCDQVLTTINSWEQHFNTHACKERKRIDADPSQYKQENAIALQDPRFNGTVPWTCDICGATARKSSRSDSLKRHKKTKHPDGEFFYPRNIALLSYYLHVQVEPPVEPPAKQPPLKRRRLE